MKLLKPDDSGVTIRLYPQSVNIDELRKEFEDFNLSEEGDCLELWIDADDKEAFDSLVHRGVNVLILALSTVPLGRVIPAITLNWSPSEYQDSFILRASEIGELASVGAILLIDTYTNC